MAVQGSRVSPEELERFYEDTQDAGLKPAWTGVGLERQANVGPFLWRWADAEPLVHRSGEIVTPDREVERRVLRLANPGLEHGTTHTISAALQLLLPGECAPAHRHTPRRSAGSCKEKGPIPRWRRQVQHGAGRPNSDTVLDLARPRQRRY